MFLAREIHFIHQISCEYNYLKRSAVELWSCASRLTKLGKKKLKEAKKLSAPSV